MTMSEGASSNGLVTVTSRYGVDETLQRLLEMLKAKGIKVFAIVDHSGEAAAAGLRMAPTKLVIFGNPAGGTPMMNTARTLAIDLPLKLLIREEGAAQEGGPEDGGLRVLVSFNSAEYLAERHGLPVEMAGVLKAVESLARALTTYAP